jgi:hypothetical protein
MKRLISSAAVLAVLVLPVAAYADAPSAVGASGGQTINGVISAVDGEHRLTLRVGRGLEDSVTLHRGTIINPTGLQLEPGMKVAIAGRADGNTFDAEKIVGSPDAQSVARASWRESAANASFNDQWPVPMGRD